MSCGSVQSSAAKECDSYYHCLGLNPKTKIFNFTLLGIIPTILSLWIIVLYFTDFPNDNIINLGIPINIIMVCFGMFLLIALPKMKIKVTESDPESKIMLKDENEDSSEDLNHNQNEFKNKYKTFLFIFGIVIIFMHSLMFGFWIYILVSNYSKTK